MSDITNNDLIQKANSVIKTTDNKDSITGSVGCALITDKGNIYTGVCIETESKTSICAEQNAITEMIKAGENKINKIIATWKDEKGVAATDLAFGVTEQQEGIVLPFLNAQMLIGIPQRWEGMNDEFFDLAAKHPQFAYRSSDDYHTKVILPNAYAALGGNFCHSFHHGTLANMAHLPIYFSGMNHAIDSMNIPSETPVRLFSNGKEGYLKIEK